MELENLFGLPAHPLIVHAAVVLLPLAAIGALVVAVVPRARRHYAPVVFGVALAATIAVGLAQGSGESLEERVDRTALVRDHTREADMVLPWSIAVTVVAGAIAVADPLRRRVPRVSATATTAVLVVAALAVGAGATYSIVEVGHSGAKAAWHDTTERGQAQGPGH